MLLVPAAVLGVHHGPTLGLAVLLCVAVLVMIAAGVVLDSRSTAVVGSVASRDEARALPLRVLVVGSGRVAQEVAVAIESRGGAQIVGFVDDEGSAETSCPWPLVGQRADTPRLVRELEIDQVIIAEAPSWQQELATEMAHRAPGTGLAVVPTLYEAMLPATRVRSLGDIALIEMGAGPRRPYDSAKRCFDLLGSALGLVLTSPITILVALAVKVTSRGPIIFAQDRIGANGSPFTLYKFRTMIQDAEAETGPVLSGGDGDARLTRIGRWLRRARLDELPQLWNVLRGDMSIVGPRPERGCFVAEYIEEHPGYAHRHSVRPGITGLAQVCGGYHTRPCDKLRFDLIYVCNRSIWMDLSILARTIAVVVNLRGK